MEKCKAETPIDGNSTEKENGQMPDAGQMPNEAQNVVGGQMLNNAEIVDQMPNENEAIAPDEEEELANPRKRYKRYKCSKCSARFGDRFCLRGHEAIHKRRGNPAYPINCPYCNASFDNKNALAAHRRIHGVKTQPKAKVVRGPGRPKGSTKRNRPHQPNNDGAEDPQPNNDGAENPPANNDGAGAEEGNHAEVEIIEPPKKRVGRPRKLVPRRVAAAHNELLVADAANANAPGPSSAGSAGPSSISTIVKECAKSNGVLHNIELRDNDAVCKIGKIEFR